MKFILVTGGAGYIGSIVSTQLCDQGYNVTCVDKLVFGSEPILHLRNNENFTFINCDINDYEKFSEIINSNKYDCIIHLAAIVGDPACKLYSAEANQTNFISTKWLIDKCIEAKIEKFIFASTCSNYGKSENSSEFIREDAPLKPLSIYADLKVKIEEYILNKQSKSKNFYPTILRFSTVYGHSYRMRFDLTVNEFTKELANGNELIVFGEQFWRPYCHVDDFANAFIAVLNSDRDKVAYNVYNVGETNENYTKKMIVDMLREKIPDTNIKFVKKLEDPRDYRVNSDKIKYELGFKISKTVMDGIEEILDLIKNKHYSDTENQIYYNIPHETKT